MILDFRSRTKKSESATLLLMHLISDYIQINSRKAIKDLLPSFCIKNKWFICSANYHYLVLLPDLYVLRVFVATP